MQSKLCAISLAIVLLMPMSAECRAEELPESFPNDVPIAEYMEVADVILGEWYQTEAGRKLGVDDTLVVRMKTFDKSISDVVMWFRDGHTDADWWLMEERAHRYVVTMLFRKDERLSIVQVADIPYDHTDHDTCHDHKESPEKHIILELTSVESYMRRGVPREK